MARDFSSAIRFTPYTRRDPVTGTVKTHLRSPNARQTSQRLLAFQNCVADGMRGRTFTGPDAARQVRQAFAETARACAGARAGTRANAATRT